MKLNRLARSISCKTKHSLLLILIDATKVYVNFEADSAISPYIDMSFAVSLFCPCTGGPA
jgi:hypothetical protein